MSSVKIYDILELKKKKKPLKIGSQDQLSHWWQILNLIFQLSLNYRKGQ